MSLALAAAAGTTVLLVVVEAALVRDGHVPAGAFAALGVVGALVLGLGAKTLGAWLQRPAPPEESGDRWEVEP